MGTFNGQRDGLRTRLQSPAKFGHAALAEGVGTHNLTKLDSLFVGHGSREEFFELRLK